VDAGWGTGNGAGAYGGAGAGGEGGGALGGPDADWLRRHRREILSRVQRRIDEAPYPVKAAVRGWTGQVRVSFTLREDGSVADARIEASSGHDVLDRAALRAVQRAAPFPAPPREILVSVPVLFLLS
jgi:protein TonB